MLNPREDKARKLRLKREKGKRQAEESLASFIRQSWHIIEAERNYSHNWHIDIIAEHLEAVTRREIRNLLINIPPRHSKSTMVSVCWPAWVWGPSQMGNECWLYGSYSPKLATRDSVKCRRILDSQWYLDNWGDYFFDGKDRADWPVSILRPDQNEKMRYENLKSGVRIATTPGGTGTGDGGDVIVCDDPSKVKGIESTVQRESILEWWDDEMSTRFMEPTRGCKVIVMQRVHALDLSGHILEQAEDNWEHLALPFEYEKKISVDMKGTSLFDPKKDDPRTEEGELLWKERFDEKSVNDLKTSMTVYQQSGQLQQRPTPKEGTIFKRKWFKKRWTTLPAFSRVIQTWDLTFGESETSAYNVGYTLGLDTPNIYVIDELRIKMDINGQIKQLPLFRKLHPNCREILVENAANGKAAVGLLKKKIPGLILVTPKGSKEDRADAVTYLFEGGNVYFPQDDYEGWATMPDKEDEVVVEEAIEEIISFGPKARYRDRVDSLVHGLEKLGRVMTSLDFDITSKTKLSDWNLT